MTYLLLCAGFLAAAAAVAVTTRRRRVLSVAALAITAAALVALTAVFDNLMIAAGLFAYAEDQRVSGLTLGAAPIEDFAYPLAAVILLPALWGALRRHDDP
ncbi:MULTISPECIES: lycopene cyclase domain-containing protein [unclassified Microbacterium]|uniref:lycopene cyclase domain-containing protein n=1 Tax=unclassified Microbacterium TaxID=2609290 RepID=UPI0012FBEFA5|nr:lycopene cyclase domain-containing protein [Microbacterium sp. MAH-37]MVQ41136.1 lycopene cyclase domain-containing protein [Microbacterium sp. MAH-37]